VTLHQEKVLYDCPHKKLFTKELIYCSKNFKAYGFSSKV